MDRRTFLTGVLGLAGAAAVATAVRPVSAVAGVPDARGILDELDASAPDVVDDGGEPEVQLADYHGGRRSHRGHRRHHHRPRRRHRRHVWKRVCRRYWHHGRWHRRCRRERVWAWFYL
jgi:hypothetical protein